MFTDIKQYYTFLDSINANDVQIFALSNKLKTIKGDFNDLESVFKTEIYFNDFQIKQGEFAPKSAYGNECFTALTQSDNDSYLQERALNCKNPRFSAKYNHLIFLKTKNNLFAKNAIDNYFEQIKSLTDLSQNTHKRLYIDAFENLTHLIKSIKYKEQEIVLLSKEIIANYSIEGSYIIFTLTTLIENLKISLQDKMFFLNYISDTIETNTFKDSKESSLKFAIHLAKKVSNFELQKKFHNQLGDFYVDEGNRVGGMIAHNTFHKAMNCYKKTSNTEKLNQVSVLMQKAKENNGLTKVNFSHSNPVLDFYFEIMNNGINSLLENEDSNSIIEYLISGKDLYPKASMLDSFHKPETLDYVTTATFDKNKNISLNTYKGINSYNFQIQLLTLEQLKLIFNLGQKNGKLNFNSLRNYFETETWYYKTENSLESEVNSTNWLDLILPPIKMYFDLIENKEVTTLNNQKLILVIDSLTLKFEGVLRDFLFRIGGQTIEANENGTAERISFENLLNNNVFKSFVAEDDCAFFKYLFTREGINLRNNIAHCFYKPKDYSPKLVWLLICAFLKLGNNKFQIIEVQD